MQEVSPSLDQATTCREGMAVTGICATQAADAQRFSQSHPVTSSPLPFLASPWREKGSVVRELSRCEVYLHSP